MPIGRGHFCHWRFVGCRSEYFSSFGGAGGTRSVASALIERLGCRVLLLFVRHACLLRPLTQAGKLQLAKVPYSSKVHAPAAPRPPPPAARVPPTIGHPGPELSPAAAQKIPRYFPRFLGTFREQARYSLCAVWVVVRTCGHAKRVLAQIFN